MPARYVQNCIDSTAKRIDVYFENRSTLVVKDNGVGMNKEELTKALQLGKSAKTENEIGWRGIGLWSGVPTCRKIVIITKKQQNPKIRIEIDADRLRQQYTAPIPATKVLSEVTGNIQELELGNDETIQDSQYTIVRLEEILPNQLGIFNEKDISEYLSSTIPVPFNVRKFKLGKEINKRLLENGVKTHEAVVFFDNQQVFRPPYTDDVFFDNLVDKKFVIDDQPVAYGWFLSSRSNRALNPPNRGLYFKKKGMTIGDEALISKLSGQTYNQWQYGEIHVIVESLRENAARNNFEANNDIIKEFYGQVKEFVNSFQLMNHYQSHYVISNSIERLKKQADIEDAKAMRGKIFRLKDRLGRNRSFPTDPALQGMKKVIHDVTKKDKAALKQLQEQVEAREKERKSDPIKDMKSQFTEYAKMAYPSLKKQLEKTTQKGKMEFNIDTMKPIQELLQQKTGLTLDSICELSKKAYDWKEVTKGDTGPLLSLSGNAYDDRQFGVMIFALHHLFVDKFKHEQGKPAFAFFESMTEEEKLHILMDFTATQYLIMRLIEKSEPARKK